MIFSRTEDFFKMFHSESKSRGSIVLERRCGKNLQQSQVSTRDLALISKNACGVEDIFFSTATYLGHPLLLNFSQTNCIHLQIPKTDLITETLVKIRLENYGIPLPTTITFDGEHLTFLWILETPLQNNEFYIYTLMQQFLFNVAKEFNPTKSNLDAVFLTRMVGSINKKNKTYSHIINDYGKIYQKDYLVNRILDSNKISASRFRELEIQAGTTLELMALLRDRWFSTYQHPELFHDWIIFFGASLCSFCESNQLIKELRAIAESLENKNWKDIQEQYSTLIDALANTAKEGYIDIEGKNYSINGPMWRDLIQGKLHISDKEISELHLQVIGNQSDISSYLHTQTMHIYPVGQTNFIPIERLLLKVA